MGEEKIKSICLGGMENKGVMVFIISSPSEAMRHPNAQYRDHGEFVSWYVVSFWEVNGK